MEDKLIDFTTAKLAKEKGFNIVSKHWYDQTEALNPIEGIRGAMMYFNVGYAPTQSLLQRWLREVHNLHIYIDTTPLFDKMQGSKYKSTIKVPFSPFKWTTGHYYLGNTYEEALEEGLLQGLKLIK